MYCHILRVRAIPTLESTDSMIIERESSVVNNHNDYYRERESSVVNNHNK